jgi:branched-chain amino acid transport system ATP-binding protein
MPSNKDTILNINDLTMQFGGLVAVDKVSLNVSKGDFLGIIGPNGAGKTTVFNVITGNLVPTSGSVEFEGNSIIKKDPARISHLGISRTFQNIRIFPKMTALENVSIPLHSKPTYDVFSAMLGLPFTKRRDQAIREEAMSYLGELGIEEYYAHQAGALSYGLQRRLEIARALAARPRLLLLDEPAAGMNNNECAELVEMLNSTQKKHGLTIILIEHHVDVVMELCNRIYVLHLGKLLAEGTSREIQSNPEVISAYLGERRKRHEYSLGSKES